MKRFLMVAFTGAALTILIPSADATAADLHHGGGRGYGGGHGYVGHGGGHDSSSHGYSGRRANYGGHGITGHSATSRYYGSGYGGYAPIYGGHYTPSYRPYRPTCRGHGGVHLDVGRLHLGVGGHH